MDGNYAEADEVTELAAWNKYRVLLMRIDISKTPSIEWPVSPDVILSEAYNTKPGLTARLVFATQVQASPERMGSSCHKKPSILGRWPLLLRHLETALVWVA